MADPLRSAPVGPATPSAPAATRPALATSSPTATAADAPPSRAQVLAAFAAVYVIWGSTYLGIMYAIRTIPPFLMAGSRFVLAGGIMLLASRLRGEEREAPAGTTTGAMWRSLAIVGLLLFVGGNGGVVWAEQRVPSGLTALLVSMAPIFFVLMEWMRPGGRRPTRGVTAGLVLGALGMGILVGPDQLAGGQRTDLVGALVLIVASVTWAAGSLHARYAKLPAAPLFVSGAQMVTGGFLMLALGLAVGEARGFSLAQVSSTSWIAFAYLLTFGSLVGFTAYSWLLKKVSPAKASTYAYVNPLVAVFLGWAIAGEAVTARTLIAAAVIVGGVALITISKSKGR
ncbi:MAG: EamA family transporter [Gemmatimonadaceae bacterium]